jgi:hypothetical protein
VVVAIDGATCNIVWENVETDLTPLTISAPKLHPDPPGVVKWTGGLKSGRVHQKLLQGIA